MSSSEKAPPPEYEEVPTESSGLPSDALAQAVAVIEGEAAERAITSISNGTEVDEETAGNRHDPHQSSTIDSFYQYHTGLDEQPSAEELNVPPPAYSHTWGHIQEEQGGLGTNARVAEDGRVNIRIDQRSRKISSLLVPALRQQLDHVREQGPAPPPYIPEALGGKPGTKLPPPLNIVIHVVGSRGDVQPFVALGKVLKDSYGHRIRLATHATFQKFVEENGLEFFCIGGDPSELMAFMVKNPGLMPGFDAIRKGDIGQRRHGIGEIIKGCWRSCFEIGDGMGDAANDMLLRNTGGQEIKLAYQHAAAGTPFIADAIIANPPSFAHVHCAERLGIPLHMMFTMPWSPTQSFPHPLANIQSSDADASITNFMSYALVDMLTWQGLGDIINRFRVHSLQLEPISLMWAPGMLARLRVPWTYCWSPALIPKPKDWAPHISISGFYFLNLATNYTPAPDLQEFLEAGPPPVYIGFGSIVVDDPNALTKMIFEAVQQTGQRALVSKGWGGIGADDLGIPEGVFMLGNVPHDWLFQHVSCVVHHGGAGTTAAGIAAGKPTFIVPFFGDQPFWGAMVARAGAGPKPIPHKLLTADNLAESIKFCLMSESQVKAKAMAAQISQEKGNEAGAESFHQMLPGGVDGMRCAIMPERGAVWRTKKSNIRLSALTACILAEEKILSFSDLKLFRAKEYETDDGPWDPISGGAGALVGTMGSMMMGVADLPIETLKMLKIHPDAKKKTSQEVETSSILAGTSHAPAGPSSPPSSIAGALINASTIAGASSTPTLASTSSVSLPGSTPARNSLEGSSSLKKTTTSSTNASTPSLEENGSVIDPEDTATPLSPRRTSSNTIRRKPVSPTAQSSTMSSTYFSPVATSAQSSNITDPDSSTMMTDITPVASPLSEPLDGHKLVVPDQHHRSMSSVFSHSPSRSGSATSSRPSSRGSSPPGTTRERSHSRTASAKAMLQSEYEANKHAKLDTILGTGKGMQRIIGAGLKSPMDFSLALAKGFHNMPRLYGDDTIREVDKVTGVQSGIKTAAKEFGYGMFDGITGLVTQPLRGAKKSGAEGFVKGIGKGIAGVVAKPGAGIYGIPAYMMKGVYQEVQKRFSESVNNYIIASRTAQGYADFTATGREERKEVVHKFLELQADALSRRGKMDEQVDALRERWDQRREKNKVERADRDAVRSEKRLRKGSKGKGKEREGEKENSASRDWGKDLMQLTNELAQKYREHHQSKQELDGAPIDHTVSAPLNDSRTELNSRPTGSSAELESTASTPSRGVAELPGDRPASRDRLHVSHAKTYPQPEPKHHEATVFDPDVKVEHQVHYEDMDNDEDDELEEAIRMSVQQTSRGDEDEDELIAKAIRVSIQALESERLKSKDEDEELQSAVAASVTEAAKHRPEGVDEEEYDRNLEEVLRKSMLEQRSQGRSLRTARAKGSDSEWDDSSDEYAPTESDDEFKKAVDMSMMTPAPTRADGAVHSHEVEEEELKKAMEESVLTPASTRNDALTAEEEEELLQKAMEESKLAPAPPKKSEEEEAEELKKAMEESKRQLQHAPTMDMHADDEELMKAVEQSKTDAEKQREEDEKRRREEDIVMEYVKKQSLMEEELRRKRLQGRDDDGEEVGEVGEASGTS